MPTFYLFISKVTIISTKRSIESTLVYDNERLIHWLIDWLTGLPIDLLFTDYLRYWFQFRLFIIVVCVSWNRSKFHSPGHTFHLLLTNFVCFFTSVKNLRLNHWHQFDWQRNHSKANWRHCNVSHVTKMLWSDWL